MLCAAEREETGCGHMALPGLRQDHDWRCLDSADRGSRYRAFDDCTSSQADGRLEVMLLIIANNADDL